MGLAVRRKNTKTGGSIFMNIPRPLKTGEESSIAGNRLILADPQGEIDEEDLLEFLESIESEFWAWHREKEAAGHDD